MSAARHPLPEELELYVLGALDAVTAARLERHAGRCASCAAALAEEARLENTLRRLVPAVRRAPAKVVPLRAPVSGSDASGARTRAPSRCAGFAQGLRGGTTQTPEYEHEHEPQMGRTRVGSRTPSPPPPPRVGWLGTLAAAAVIVLAVWGLEGRGASGARVAGRADGSALVCEAEAPLCPWPAVMASMAPVPAENACREPAGASCAVQSRMP